MPLSHQGKRISENDALRQKHTVCALNVAKSVQLYILAIIAHLVSAVDVLHLQSRSVTRTQNVHHLGIYQTLGNFLEPIICKS